MPENKNPLSGIKRGQFPEPRYAFRMLIAYATVAILGGVAFVIVATAITYPMFAGSFVLGVASGVLAYRYDALIKRKFADWFRMIAPRGIVSARPTA